jgi:hypothetical protein
MTEWTKAELHFFRRLDTPMKIQLYLNGLAYDAAPGTASPRRVMRERRANCFEGALLAAAALGQQGRPPLVVDMRAENDDDHVIAVFKEDGRWGAVAKSNFTSIRFREPVYQTLRELVMSYFDFFFNVLGEKSLREYSRPMSLRRFERRGWMTTDSDISDIGDALDAVKHYKVLTLRQVRRLELVDGDVLRAGLLVANKAGLYRARKA